jgi:hypothetical protein
MPTNVRRSSGAGTAGLAPLTTPQVKPSESLVTKAAPNEVKPVAEPSQYTPDDWSKPETHHQMSAIWPLLWLAIPFVLLVLYGVLGGD